MNIEIVSFLLGTVLIFIYGIPKYIDTKVQNSLISEGTDQVEKKEIAKYKLIFTCS